MKFYMMENIPGRQKIATTYLFPVLRLLSYSGDMLHGPSEEIVASYLRTSLC